MVPCTPSHHRRTLSLPRVLSTTRIGFGDFVPSTPITKALVMIYLPVSVAALAQALTDISAISLRRAVRETDCTRHAASAPTQTRTCARRRGSRPHRAACIASARRAACIASAHSISAPRLLSLRLLASRPVASRPLIASTRTDGDSLAADFLKDECLRNETPDESLTEAEFLVAVLLRTQIVDELTIAAVRRQFRELVRDGDETTPVESRVFDPRRLYDSRVMRGKVVQRAPDVPPGKRLDGGKTAVVDLTAADGGFAEWRKHYWDPLIEAGVPPETARSLHAARRANVGNRGPLALLQQIVLV
jgi:hypothetical protein